MLYMASSFGIDDMDPPRFHVGHHELGRELLITDDVLLFAQQECNYDTLTVPVTNSIFQSRVCSALSTYLADKDMAGYVPEHSFPPLVISSLAPEETVIGPTNSISQLILTTSPWIDLDSDDPLIFDVSRQVLNLEVQYAAFCGAKVVIVEGPRTLRGHQRPDGLSQYARALKGALCLSPFVQILVHLPIAWGLNAEPERGPDDLTQLARPMFTPSIRSSDEPKDHVFGSWDAWNVIRDVCKYSAKLSVALTISRHLPPLTLQLRWYSEPVRVLHMPCGSFHQNKHGQPSLSQQQRQLVAHFMSLSNPPWILLSDVGPLGHSAFRSNVDTSSEQSSMSALVDSRDNGTTNESYPTPAEASRKTSNTEQKRKHGALHLEHIRQLQHKLAPRSPMDRFGAGYQDYLQNPLQPLSDNLESITYEVFEKDPIKYDWYERAIDLALREWRSGGKSTSDPDGRVVVAVVGAGRGPIVNRALRASANSGVAIDLWAVEKNPNAFVLLQQHNSKQWGNRVKLVQADMRSWDGPSSCLSPPSLTPQHTTDKVHSGIDILVSELLGSFGDNELSPECIDGVQRHLNPQHGISIPSSYTSHLTPIAAPKLHADILARIASGDPDASQIPYVVMLQAVDMLSTTHRPGPLASGTERIDTPLSSRIAPTVLKAWEFSHPLPSISLSKPAWWNSKVGNEHNQRFARLNFQCKDRGVCHGLGGYFEAVLYDPRGGHHVELAPSFQRGNNSTPMNLSAAEYGGVILSTNPLTANEMSKDMISWFPIFFPLKAPLYFPDNSLLSVSIWRQTDGRKVWYEWMVESFMLLDVSTQGTPKVERLGSTDLHSSYANACLL